MYITNWHRLMGQSISHCMWLRGPARFLWTRSKMIFLCSPPPAALRTASDSAPYCFDFEPAKQEMTCHFNRGWFPTYSPSAPNLFLFQLYQQLRRDTEDSFVLKMLQWQSCGNFQENWSFLNSLCFKTFNWSSCNGRNEEMEQWVSPQTS